jgi:siroheme synthase
VVRWGTTAAQDCVAGTLADIAERAAHLAPPAVIVVGDVVSLRELSPAISSRGAALVEQAHVAELDPA